MNIQISTANHTLVQAMNRLHQLSFIHSERITLFYLVALFSVLAVYMFTIPIIITDTDLWYHLNGGRYFWETGSISSSTFFSFIEPEKYRTNYFWGFQATIYKIYEYTGYHGLLFFKALLVLTSAYFVSKVIVGIPELKKAHVFQLLLIALIIYLISTRGNIVRPHLVSYAMIPAFIYILLHNRKYIFALPFLTVIWVNFHGVEWPVGALICGSFFLQYIYDFKKRDDRKKLGNAIWIALCIPAIFVNPYGYNILLAPFALDPDTYLFISELKETSIFTSNIFTEHPSFSHKGIIFLLFGINIYALIVLWLKNKLSLGKTLLSIGALLLLFRGQRFIWEWVLLSTPVFWSACIHIYRDNPIKHKHAVSSSIIIIALISPLALWSSELNSYNNHPYDYTNTPTPTTRFIEHIGLKNAKYMAPPSLSGYIQWELYPDTLVHSDMEFPPFDGMDYFEFIKSITSEAGLEHIIKKYNPDYLGAPLLLRSFQSNLANSDTFTPVFMDDHIVLYINRKKHPELANKYQLEYINPFNLFNGIQNKDITLFISELKRLVAFSEFSQENLIALISYLIVNKQNTEALDYISILQEKYRKNPNIYFLRGQVYENMGEYELAVNTYKKALEERKSSLTSTLHLYLADSYYQVENYSMAYKHFRESFNPYQKNENLKRYFKFGYSSIVVGDIRRGRRLLAQMLLLNNNKLDEELVINAKKLIEKIDNGQFRGSLINF